MNGNEYVKTILKIWEYKKGKYTDLLKTELNKYYSGKAFLFENARSAEYVFLKSLGLNEGDEVIVQAFTCNAVVNPILWNKLIPIYVDINQKDFCMNIDDLKRKITEKTKVIILQHTFGNRADIESVKQIVKDQKEKNNQNILVLEDCAHALGVKDLGNNFDASIVSFGIEKILSTRVGGALILNNLDLENNIALEYNKLGTMSFWATYIWLLNPIFWRILRKFKASQMKYAKMLNGLGLLNMGFFKSELKGIKPVSYPKKLSNALAKVVYMSIQTLQSNLNHRMDISNIYSSQISVSQNSKRSYVRYPLIIESDQAREAIKSKLYELGVVTGDWYNPIIYPNGTDLNSMLYPSGSCRNAEEVGSKILNLPTGINISNVLAQDISEVIYEYMKH